MKQKVWKVVTVCVNEQNQILAGVAVLPAISARVALNTVLNQMVQADKDRLDSISVTFTGVVTEVSNVVTPETFRR